jgi:ribonuclease HI
MSKKTKKYYVVWEGRNPGIFNTWDECKAQTDGVAQAKFKSFTSLDLATLAFHSGPDNYYGKEVQEAPKLSASELARIGKPQLESIVVDGACSGRSGDMEYKGIYLATKELLFLQGPFKDGTNNIAEFLAIVHALAFCKQKNISIPIYSDSATAISWIKAKTARTKLAPTKNNKIIFELIERAETWLNTNSFPNKILKWETEAWGENPADFGRK